MTITITIVKKNLLSFKRKCKHFIRKQKENKKPNCFFGTILFSIKVKILFLNNTHTIKKIKVK